MSSAPSLDPVAAASLQPAVLHQLCALVPTEEEYVEQALSFIFSFQELHFFLFFFFYLFAFSRATPAAYGGSQARSRIGAVAACLCQSHSNAGSKPRL